MAAFILCMCKPCCNGQPHWLKLPKNQILDIRSSEASSSRGPGAANLDRGFKLRYLIQCANKVTGEGPHVMEVTFRKAKLQWPYLLHSDFIHDMTQTFSHYVFAPWVARYAVVGLPSLHLSVPMEETPVARLMQAMLQAPCL